MYVVSLFFKQYFFHHFLKSSGNVLRDCQFLCLPSVPLFTVKMRFERNVAFKNYQLGFAFRLIVVFKLWACRSQTSLYLPSYSTNINIVCDVGL